MSHSPRVSVVCLSFNRPHLLREALRSIRGQTSPLHEVLVVDNRSERSGEVAAVVAEFPEARLIAHPDNRGYTGGMNAGLRAATGDYVVLTEDDITLAPDAVAAVVERLAHNSQLGLVGGLMLNRVAGTIRCAGGRVRLGTRFELEVIGESKPDTGRFTEPFKVTYLPGAFLAARKGVWDDLGGFRERYFAYMEDVDLCLRAVKAGLVLEVVPAARVWHTDPPTDAEPPAWLVQLKYQNLLRLYLLNAAGRVLVFSLLRYAVLVPLRRPFGGKLDGWASAVAVARTLTELPELLRERRMTDYHRNPNRG